MGIVHPVASLPKNLRIKFKNLQSICGLWRKVRRTWRPRNQETRDRLQILESTITLMIVRIMKAIGSKENRDSMIEEVESHGNDLVVSLDLEVATGEMEEKTSDLSLARKMLRIVIVPKTKKSNQLFLTCLQDARN